MENNKENLKRIRNLIVFTILLYLGVQHIDVVFQVVCNLFGLISPFVLGAGIAFVLNVPMSAIEKQIEKIGGKRKYIRPLSLVSTIVCVILVIVIVLFVVVPELAATLMSLKDLVPAFLVRVQEAAEKLFAENPRIVEEIASIKIDWEEIVNEVISFLKNGAGSVLNSTVSVAVSVVSGIANFFIGFVFACYILLQKEKLAVQVKKAMYAFIPVKKADRILEICTLSSKTFSNFLTGQGMEALILGFMFFITMLILRFPYALLVGVLVAFTALIPIFGAFIGCAVGAFLILMVSPVKALGFLVLFLVLQQIEGNFIYPHVVGNSVGLPSMWVLVAVSLGGSTMGVLGMIIFIPLISVIYTLFREEVYQRIGGRKELEDKF
ncbi:MAG: AI-2E family transporter [Lachnospiraceae bacterium]|nr:AI-2E family transporter [Lachnospiraceae bacterium]